jgi:hypothetical protein
MQVTAPRVGRQVAGAAREATLAVDPQQLDRDQHMPGVRHDGV